MLPPPLTLPLTLPIPSPLPLTLTRQAPVTVVATAADTAPDYAVDPADTPAPCKHLYTNLSQKNSRGVEVNSDVIWLTIQVGKEKLNPVQNPK